MGYEGITFTIFCDEKHSPSFVTRLDASTGTVTVAETAASSVCGCEASSVAADVEYVTALGVEQVPTPTSCGTTDANARDAV